MQADSSTPSDDSNALSNGLPTEAERNALGQSGPLIRYACENVANVDGDVLLTIARAREACAKSQWTPEISQSFWRAFNVLCELVKPVTIDGLLALHRNSPTTSWLRFWRSPINESLGERSTRRYTASLTALLGIIIVVQLFAWMYSNLAKDLDTKGESVRSAANALQAECDSYSSSLTSATSPLPAVAASAPGIASLPQAANARVKLRNDLADVSVSDRTLLDSSRFLQSVIFSGSYELVFPLPQSKDDLVESCRSVSQRVRVSVEFAQHVSDRARLITSVLLQFLLPVLLGAIGALAYVMRNTSDQIRSSTFFSTSPVRNLVRIVLGALMGVIIGLFTHITSQIDLGPLAWAFLAGYGVEPVFSLFDALIGRLKV